MSGFHRHTKSPRISFGARFISCGVVVCIGYAALSFNAFNTGRSSNCRCRDAARGLSVLDYRTRTSFDARQEKQRQLIAQKIRTTGSAADAERLAKVIVEVSCHERYDPLVVASVVQAESTFNSRAESHRGAKGLMQLMPPTARYISELSGIGWRGNASLSDPYYNLRVGISYLKYLEERFGTHPYHVLIAYNWGPSNLRRALKDQKKVIGPMAQYARKVMDTHRRWSNELAKKA